MLNEKNLTDYFWVEIVATTIYIMNQTFMKAIHWHDTKSETQN